MAKLSIEIDSSNEAFSEDAAFECGRIVRKIADKLYDGLVSGPCVDYNGNLVGSWSLSEIGEEEAAKQFATIAGGLAKIAEHSRGEHAGRKDNDCPQCSRAEVEA